MDPIAGGEEERVLQELRELVEISSPSGEESEIAQLLSQKLEAIGLVPEIDPEGNLTARRDEGKEETLILNGHMDTVPGKVPVRVEGDRLYGRGTVDMKGGLVGILEALRELKGERLRYNLAVQMVVGEEGPSSGTWTVLEREEEVRRHFALVAEPTRLQILLGQKGRAVFRVQVRGEACHSSRPELGKNAILLACRAIQVIRQVKPRVHEILGPGRLNVTMISGGSWSNIIPDECVLTLDRRLTLGEGEESSRKELEEALRGLDAEVALEERGAPISIPFLLPRENPFIDRLARSVERHREVSFGVKSATTDASYLVRKGIPAVIFGPGDPSLAHTREESINIGEVLLFKRILVDFLKER
jgi:succinyl-diaminopimelate desuccinylase